MKVTDIKRRLINKINKSNDDQLLVDLDSLLKDDSRKEVYILSKAQLEAITEAREEIARGEFLTDAEARRRTEKWLGK
jgi:hypothetical protein